MMGKFIEKIITNLYIKIIQRKQKKEQKKKLTEQDKRKAVLYKQLKELYSFIKWLNTKGLKTRRIRKSFWRAVKEGRPVIEDTLNNLIQSYAPKPKAPAGRLIKGGEIEKKPKGDKLIVKEDKRPSLQGKPAVIKLGDKEKK